MKRRLCGIALAVVAGTGMLTACGGGNSGKTKIKFFGWGNIEEITIFTELIDRFEKKYPEYIVDYSTTDAESYLIALSSNSPKTMPDLFYMPDTDFVRYAMQSDLMLDITPYLDASETVDRNDVYEEGLSAYMYDKETNTLGTGSVYALPKDLGPNVMVYNKSVFLSQGITIVSEEKSDSMQYPYGYGYYDEGGSVKKILNDRIPMTWAQFVQLCQDVQTGPLNSTSTVVGVTHYPWELAYLTTGGEYFDGSYQNVTIDNDAFAAAVQFGADLYKWGVMPSTSQQASQNYVQRFTSGLAAITFMGAWNTPELWACNFEWDALPIPVPNESYLKGYTYDSRTGGDKNVPESLMKEGAKEGSISKYHLGSVGFAVYRDTKVADAAYKLAEYFAYDEDAQRYLYQIGQSVPNLKSMAEGEFLTAKLDDPMYESKGWNRPANKKVYIDMLSNAKRRAYSYTFNAEWYDEIEESSEEELKLRNVWDLNTVLWDWQTGAKQGDFLQRLAAKVQTKYDSKNKKNGEVVFQWANK